MEVILLQDIERVGHEGEVLKVSDGYARNYLIPRKLAVLANRGNMKDLENRKGAIERRDSEKRDAAVALAEELKGKTVTVKHVAGQGLKLHGTVTTQQIADAANAQLNLKLDKRDLELAEPIREIGNYLVSVRVYKDVHAQLPVHVVSEKNTEEEQAIEEAFAEAEAAVAAAAQAAPPADVAEEADEAEDEA